MTDPLDHLESYKAIMQVQGATDALLCIAFPATLRKAARAWYSRLPPRGVDSFQQLERSFLTHFDACRKIPRVLDSLFAVQQKEGESLKDFVTRFKVAALEVYHLDDAIATLALKRGLRPSRFTYSLDKRPPSSYADLLSHAQKYIRADEADSSRRGAEGRLGKRPARSELSGPPLKKPEPSRRLVDRRRSIAPREAPLTPLLAPRAHILMEIENESYLRRPPPLKKGTMRDRSRYCRFHRDYGHDTEECRNLKQSIEELIRRGYLGQYVRKTKAPPIPALMGPPPAQVNIDNAPMERMVGMITRGGASSSKRPRERERGARKCNPF